MWRPELAAAPPQRAGARLRWFPVLVLAALAAGIIGMQQPHAAFATLVVTPNIPATGPLGQPINMSATVASCPSAQLSWNFGDTRSGQNNTALSQSGATVQHTYATPATYAVFVTAIGCNDSGAASQAVIVGGGAAVSPITTGTTTTVVPTSSAGCGAASPGVSLTLGASPASGPVGTGVTFYIPSGSGFAGAPSYTFNFGDGTPPQTATQPLASHTYSFAGTFIATVTVTTSGGQTGCSSTAVTIGSGATGTAGSGTASSTVASTCAANSAGIQVGLSANPQSGAIGTSITLYASSSGFSGTPSYTYNFGDGTPPQTTQQPNISHTYTANGTFTPTVNVTAVITGGSQTVTGCGSTTVTIGSGAGAAATAGTGTTTVATAAVGTSAPVTANGVTASTGGPYTGSAGTPIVFNASASTTNPGATIASYVWSFGDGTSASGQQASHTYSTNSNYTVVLVVTDSTGAAVSASTTASIGNNARTVALVAGCNNVALTFPDGTPTTTVGNAITPQSAVIGIWKLVDPGTGKYQGFFPSAGAASDFTRVNRLDAVFICVSGTATLAEPAV